jgi:hypothetical protein
MVSWLSRGELRLGLVPEIGGRLLSVRFRGTELLWRDPELVDDELRGHFAPNSGRMGDWVNYGGDKTWPAPQGWDGPDQWPGPPDPVLDSGPYQAVLDGDTLTMTSAPDPRTGLRLTRAVTVLDDGYRLDLRAENISEREVRWALWNVTQLPGDGSVTAGLAGRRASAVPLIGAIPEYTVDTVDRELTVPAQEVVGKLGVPDSAGWVRWQRDGVSLTLSFDVDPDAEYPDANSPLEIWLEHPQPKPLAELGDLDPPGHITELEVLGPLTSLAPRGATSLTIRATVTAPLGE